VTILAAALSGHAKKWLESGKKIYIERAPTYFGILNLTVASHSTTGQISATIDLERRNRPAALLIRLRHPRGQPMLSVLVNGKEWTEFDPVNEWVRIANPRETHYQIEARY